MVGINFNDTITAIATAPGEAGIGIVRMSGKDALAIADKVFISKDDRTPSSFKSYTVHYGWVVENEKFEKPREIVDEVILTVMRAPRSYTREDIVEINCHGGMVALHRVLDLVRRYGARVAEPGEFTRRAFLNGRIDLSQAEAVLDMIRAKTDAAFQAGLQQLRGNLSERINNIRHSLIILLSGLEANIDFPEEDIIGVSYRDTCQALHQADQEIATVLATANFGRVLREGVTVVICGRPNVGKSSLLNAILRQERAIVTSIPGTTRDTIEETVNIQGVAVKLVDTAGILIPKGLLEEKAVERAKQHIRLADVAMLVFDGSKRLTLADVGMIRRVKQKKVIAVINKIDLKQRIEKIRIEKAFPVVLSVSAKHGRNIPELENAIFRLIGNDAIATSESVMVTNARHIDKLRSAQKYIAQALNSLDNNLSVEFVAQDIKYALRSLDEIIGRGFSEELLDRIFRQFCIGK